MFSRGSIGRSAIAARHPLAGGNYVIDASAQAAAGFETTAYVNGRIGLSGRAALALDVEAAAVRRRGITAAVDAGIDISAVVARRRQLSALSSVALDAAAFAHRRRQLPAVSSLALTVGVQVDWHMLHLGAVSRRMVLLPQDRDMSVAPEVLRADVERTMTVVSSWRDMNVPAQPRAMAVPPDPPLPLARDNRRAA